LVKKTSEGTEIFEYDGDRFWEVTIPVLTSRLVGKYKLTWKVTFERVDENGEAL